MHPSIENEVSIREDMKACFNNRFDIAQFPYAVHLQVINKPSFSIASESRNWLKKLTEASKRYSLIIINVAKIFSFFFKTATLLNKKAFCLLSI